METKSLLTQDQESQLRKEDVNLYLLLLLERRKIQLLEEKIKKLGDWIKIKELIKDMSSSKTYDVGNCNIASLVQMDASNVDKIFNGSIRKLKNPIVNKKLRYFLNIPAPRLAGDFNNQSSIIY